MIFLIDYLIHIAFQGMTFAVESKTLNVMNIMRPIFIIMLVGNTSRLRRIKTRQQTDGCLVFFGGFASYSNKK